MKLLIFLEKFDKFVRITPTEWDMYMSKESCGNNCTGTEAHRTIGNRNSKMRVDFSNGRIPAKIESNS